MFLQVLVNVLLFQQGLLLFRQVLSLLHQQVLSPLHLLQVLFMFIHHQFVCQFPVGEHSSVTEGVGSDGIEEWLFLL